MINMQALAIATPIIALVVVGLYAAFEYHRIERARATDIGTASTQLHGTAENDAEMAASAVSRHDLIRQAKEASDEALRLTERAMREMVEKLSASGATDRVNKA